MNPLRKLFEALRQTPRTPEELNAVLESKRLQDQNLDVRLSQESPAGANYQSGRGSH